MDVRQVVPRDAIPSVDDPDFGVTFGGNTDEEVIVIDSQPPRAYPIRYLHYHEIVNDVVTIAESDPMPLTVTWCPLCGSAVVYDRRIDGQTLTFGVSGKLADDDLVMYDRETDSEWKQSNGVAIAGELKGERLEIVPMSMTSWGRFQEQHPDGVVLQRPGGESEAASEDDQPAPIDYDSSPYEQYFEMEGFGLDAHRRGESTRTWNRDDLDPKAVVLGVETDREALGFPLPWIEEDDQVLTATVGRLSVAVFATPDGIHAFRNPGFDFEYRGGARFHAAGTTWNGSNGKSDDGRQLDRVPARRLFAFAWQDDHGPDAFFES